MNQLSLITETAPAVDPLPKAIEPWKQYGRVTLYHGDCRDVMRAMPSRSVDAIVTDPPYGLGFMGKEWDCFKPDAMRDSKRFQIGRGDQRISSTNPNVNGRSRSPALSPSQIEYDRTLEGQRAFQAWCEEWAREAFRVLKPGAHMLVCGAPRSSHRMVSGIEDAGFEIRDSLCWLFGQGFPKSFNLEEEFEGYGTALKPGHEPICLARKPFTLSIEDNAKEWGVGSLNIDRCRIDADTGDGRWPANVLLDQQAGVLLDQQAGVRVSGANPTRRGSDKFRKVFGKFKGEEMCVPARGAERGGPSRFYFVAKPSRFERDYGCDDLPQKTAGELTNRKDGSAGLKSPRAGAGRSGGGKNPHPTVKPVSLMQWCLWLIAPPGGVVVDPFLGSGTTGMACAVEGYTFIGIEAEPREDGATFEYLEAADARIREALEDAAAAS